MVLWPFVQTLPDQFPDETHQERAYSGSDA